MLKALGAEASTTAAAIVVLVPVDGSESEKARCVATICMSYERMRRQLIWAR